MCIKTYLKFVIPWTFVSVSPALTANTPITRYKISYQHELIILLNCRLSASSNLQPYDLCLKVSYVFAVPQSTRGRKYPTRLPVQFVINYAVSLITLSIIQLTMAPGICTPGNNQKTIISPIRKIVERGNYHPHILRTLISERVELIRKTYSSACLRELSWSGPSVSSLIIVRVPDSDR